MPQRRLMRGSRGQAVVETAIFVPLATLVLFAVVWSMKVGAVDERTQMAVRYSGLVSQVANPYDDYSLYATYNNLTNIDTQKTAPTGCVAPTKDALWNSGTFPGPQSGAFWWNVGDTPSGACVQTNVHNLIAGVWQTQIVLSNEPQITATINDVPSFMQPIVGATSSLSAQTNFYKPPNINIIMNCYNSGSPTDLQDMAQASFQPWVNQGPTPTAIPTPYPAATVPTVLTPNC